MLCRHRTPAAGERAQGVKALKNVLRGDPQYWEVDLAYYELRRLGEAAEAPGAPALSAPASVA